MGGCGASSDGESPWKTLTLSQVDFFCDISTSRFEKRRENTIGASDVVSLPTAMPEEICPIAILAPIPNAACKLVPQASISVIPGVEGASRDPITASRAKFQSFECVTTAPPTTSSMWAPCNPYRSAVASMTAVIISRFVRSA